MKSRSADVPARSAEGHVLPGQEPVGRFPDDVFLPPGREAPAAGATASAASGGAEAGTAGASPFDPAVPETLRLRFASLDLNPVQHQFLAHLARQLASAPTDAAEQAWLQAIDRFRQLADASQKSRRNYERSLQRMSNTPLLRSWQPPPRMMVHEYLQYQRIAALIKGSWAAKDLGVGGYVTALDLLHTAQRQILDLESTHLSTEPDDEAMSRAIGHAMEGLPSGNLDRRALRHFGVFLWRSERLAGPAAVVDALRFTSRCAARSGDLLAAMLSTRLRFQLIRDGMPPRTADRIAPLLQAEGTTNLAGLAIAARALAQLPEHALDMLVDSPLMIRVCRRSVAEAYPSRHGHGVKELVPARRGAELPAPVYWEDLAALFRPGESPPSLVVALQCGPDEDEPPTDHAAPLLPMRPWVWQLPPSFELELDKALVWAETRPPVTHAVQVHPPHQDAAPPAPLDPATAPVGEPDEPRPEVDDKAAHDDARR